MKRRNNALRARAKREFPVVNKSLIESLIGIIELRHIEVGTSRNEDCARESP